MVSISVSAGSVPQNFYQKHLRRSRTASGTKEIQAKQAMGRLAARISGKELPELPLQSPPSTLTIVKEEHLSQIIKLPYSQDSLNKALVLQKRLNRPDYLLNEYIALCYWHTGQTIKAVELANSVLREVESPKIRRILFSQAISERNYDIALHHLEKSGLSRSAMIIAHARILLEKADLPLIIPTLILLALIISGMKLIKNIIKKLTADRTFNQPKVISDREIDSLTSIKTENTEDVIVNKSFPDTNEPVATEVRQEKASAEFQTFYAESALTVESSNDNEENITENTAVSAFTDPEHQILPEFPVLSAVDESDITITQPANNLEMNTSQQTEMLHSSDNTVKEQFIISSDSETLKTFFLSLQLSLSQNMIRIISIISAARAARKAAFALNLGKLFAADDYKTLLIDCNNTGSFLHEEIGLSLVPGISDLANPDCELTSVFRCLEMSQLFFITSGTQQGDETTLISEAAWDLLLDYCRKNYEIIIIIHPEAKILLNSLNLIKNTGVLVINDTTVPKETDESTLDSLKNLRDSKFLGELAAN